MKHTSQAGTLLITLLCLVLAGCAAPSVAPRGAPTADAPSAAPTTEAAPAMVPALASPLASPIPVCSAATPCAKNAELSGRVWFGPEPVPGARVQLRKPDWRINPTGAAVADALAGADGRYRFVDPPAGEYSVVAIWPDGQDSAGGTPVVQIAAGQVMPDVDLKLEKSLRLLAPDLGKPVSTSPVLEWEPLPGADRYRVMIIDSGTTAAVVQQEVAGANFTVTPPLKSGKTYDLVISALDADGQPRGNVQTQFGVGGTSEAGKESVLLVPEKCQKQGLATYVDRAMGICFAIPERFALAKNGSGAIEVTGTPAGLGPEPLFASLTIERKPAEGKDAAAFTEEYLRQFAGIPAKIERSQVTLSGDAAEVLEPVPGRLSSRQVLVAHGPNDVYILTFWPSFRDTPAAQVNAEAKQVQPQVEDLYNSIMDSFAFLPPAGQPAGGTMTVAASCIADGQPFYLSVPDRYCFSYPSGFRVEKTPTGQPLLHGPALEKSLDPLRAMLGMEVEVAARDKNLEQIVNGYAGQFKDLPVPIQRSTMTLDGRPAVVLDGVPGRGGSRDVFMLNEGTLFHLLFQPDVKSFPKAAADVERLFETVTSSFTLLPSPSTAAAGTVSGRALWGDEAVPGARIELRKPDWASNRGPALAQALTDGQGQFTMTAVPPGEYDLVGVWPDGKQSTVGTRVIVVPGSIAQDNRVEMVKELTITDPAAGSTTTPAPTLRWERVPATRYYRVVVTDMKTMEGYVGEDTQETSLAVTNPLKPGPTYTLVVNAFGAEGRLLAGSSREFKVQ